VKYEGVSAGLAIERPAAGVAVLRLTGWDTGEFGDAPMRELAKDFAANLPLQLFIDARAVKGASVDVSNDWALWLRANRSRFAHISMLTGAPFVQLTAKFVQRFAELSEIMRIYTDPLAFDAALRAAIAR
jgi:hypothetical protein